MTALLEISGLTISIPSSSGDHLLVDGVDLRVDTGSSVALVGESGSGKSVTARSILRLLPDRAKVSGDVLFEGSSIFAMSNAELMRFRQTKVAMVFQDPRASINPMRTIGDFLIDGLRAGRDLARASAVEEATRLLGIVGVSRAEDRLQQYPHEFSGGMLQRVMIASAVGSGATLLLADEPTTALDVSIQAEVMALLGGLRDEFGLSVLFITHDIDLATSHCDRIDVMYAGAVVESRASSDLVAAPRHPYSAALMGCRTHIESRSARLVAIDGAPINASAARGRCAFEDRCSFAAAACSDGRPDAMSLAGDGYVRCVRADEIANDLVRLLHRPSDELAAVVAPIVIAATGLRKEFKVRGAATPTVAVDDVSLTLRRGETLGIVGESGSGKTTLGRLLLGIESADAGTIVVDGALRDGRARSAAERRKRGRQLQIVFQDPYTSLDPRQTPVSAVTEILALHRADLGRDGRLSSAVRLLREVGLDDRQCSALPAELSGGQRQRVAIAKALAADPAAIILDEAVSGLDVSIQAQVLNLLADLQESTGVAYLFISHDLSVIRQIAHRVMVMRDGSVVEEGATVSVLTDPVADYTKQLLAAVPSAAGPAA
ncbi:MAG: ABC transporter ATP-binding protein [Acidimicrobiia bacterium]|nr:ABC transporter ATP-binding protein [Acidimicrobiia bacterium]